MYQDLVLRVYDMYTSLTISICFVIVSYLCLVFNFGLTVLYSCFFDARTMWP